MADLTHAYETLLTVRHIHVGPRVHSPEARRATENVLTVFLPYLVVRRHAVTTLRYLASVHPEDDTLRTKSAQAFVHRHLQGRVICDDRVRMASDANRIEAMLYMTAANYIMHYGDGSFAAWVDKQVKRIDRALWLFAFIAQSTQRLTIWEDHKVSGGYDSLGDGWSDIHKSHVGQNLPNVVQKKNSLHLDGGVIWQDSVMDGADIRRREAVGVNLHEPYYLPCPYGQYMRALPNPQYVAALTIVPT